MEVNCDINVKITLVNDLINRSCLSNQNLMLDIFYVYENPAKIESIEIIKVNSVITKVRNHKEYKLSKHRIIVKQNEKSNIIISDDIDSQTIITNTNISSQLSQNLDNCFIRSLKTNVKSNKVVKYFKRGLIGFFVKKSPEKLIEGLLNYNWIVTSPHIASEISKCKDFILIDDCKNINHFGKIGSLNIFTNDDIKSEIICGDINSITAIVNKDISIEEFNCGNFYKQGFKIMIEYLFSSNGVDKITIN
jgi:hypothetical protein